MSAIQDRERSQVGLLLKNHPILLLVGPSLTGVVRAIEGVLGIQCRPGQDEEDRQLVWGDNHPDLSIHDGRTITVEEARELRSSATSNPMRWSSRYILISYVDRPHYTVLPTLLKLIEEPPDNFSMILTTSNVQRIPETIPSRALVITVIPSDDSEVKWWLYMKGVEDEFNIRVSSCSGDLDVAEKLSLKIVQDWERDWSSVLSGGNFHPSFPTVWTERFQDLEESTQVACWGLLGKMVVNVIADHPLWREVGLLSMNARNQVENGRMNSIMATTYLLKAYAYARTIRERG